MVLLIDNYDSFVFNLARYLREFGCETQVVRNDRITVAEVLACRPQAIVISPGPCTPQEAGISVPLLRALPADLPLLGVCLGHQAIATAYDLPVIRSTEPMHGRSSQVHHTDSGLFAGLPQPLAVGRYHSLVVPASEVRLPLRTTAWLEDGTVMALEHVSRPIYGVQFHPESILTPQGDQLLGNFLQLARIPASGCPSRELPEPVSAADDFYHRPIETPGVPPTF